jgi:oxygen-independent coproporphyrinogen-3 oxidase
MRLSAIRSAYVHVPFCRHRCGYCNFTLVAGRNDLVPRYLAAIEHQLAGEQAEIDTLYFGGGTPTQLSQAQIAALACMVLRRHPLAAGGEWTVEANPADVDADYLDRLAALGVNRLSLGGQSFRVDKLQQLERDHTPDQVIKVVELARRHGMQVAIDLIFAAPGETLANWQYDVETAIATAPDHVSTYGLTFEKGTQFWNRLQRRQLSQIDEELELAMYEYAIDRLAEAGFVHYEVSNFSRPGCQSRHNQAYWSGQGYWAYGPGASRFLPPTRETNHRSTTTWLGRVARGDDVMECRETLAPLQLARERLVFGLRQLAGVVVADFRQATGYEIDDLAGPAICRFVELGMLEYAEGRLRLTRQGLVVSDAIWPELL